MADYHRFDHLNIKESNISGISLMTLSNGDRFLFNCMGNDVFRKLHRAIKELYFWQHGYTGSFTNLLFLLIQKADPENKLRLKLVFPEIVCAFELWMLSETQDKFFRQYLPELFKSEYSNA